MTSRWICAALGLVMALSLTGCGSQTAAGTDASRWQQNNALYQRDLADGTGEVAEKKDGTYHADDRGQVDGYDSKSADRDTATDKTDGKVETDLKDAGRDLKNAVRDAARNVGDTAEDALDGMKDAADRAADDVRRTKE